MTLPSHVLVVRAEVSEDVEAEWNRWYDAAHLPEILACPGFRSGRRYRAGDSAAGRIYLALYDIDGPHVLDSAQFKARRGWGPFAGKVKFETMVFLQLSLATNSHSSRSPVGTASNQRQPRRCDDTQRPICSRSPRSRAPTLRSTRS